MKCIAIKDNQERCEAYSMSGSEYCYLHNPDISEEDRQAGRVKGGSKARIDVGVKTLRVIDIQEPSGVLELLNDTVRRVRAGSMSVKTANTLGYLATVYLRAFEVTKLEERVKALEENSLVHR